MTRTAPTDPGAPDVTRLQATIAELAADRYTGRRVGTPAGQAAATWPAHQLAGMGTTVTTEAFPVPGVRERLARQLV